jgi:acetyl esterase/lipase
VARNLRTSAGARSAVLATALAAAALIAVPPDRPGPVGDRAEAATPPAAAAVAPPARPAAVRLPAVRPPATRRRALRRPASRFALDGPRGIAVRRMRVPDPLGPRVDVYRRAGDVPPRAAVLLVHGGGWSGGGLGRMDPVARAVARAGMVAVNVGYTLASPWAAGYPRQLDELHATVRWIRRAAGRLGVDRRRIGALGSSAGGHLASLLATTGDGPLHAGTRIAAAVAWSPPLDLPALAGHRLLGPAATLLLGCPPDACPGRWAAASPLAHATPDDPPLMLVNSRREMVPAAQSEAMADRLSAASVPHELRLLEGSRHGREFADHVLADSVAFLRRWLRP